MKKIVNYINGKHVSLSSEELSVYNPATGEEISKVILSNELDFEEAIKSSKKSQWH